MSYKGLYCSLWWRWNCVQLRIRAAPKTGDPSDLAGGVLIQYAWHKHNNSEHHSKQQLSWHHSIFVLSLVGLWLIISVPFSCFFPRTFARMFTPMREIGLKEVSQNKSDKINDDLHCEYSHFTFLMLHLINIIIKILFFNKICMRISNANKYKLLTLYMLWIISFH